MTAPTPASNGIHVPWKVRWSLYACGLFCLIAIPGTVADLAERAIHGAAIILHMDDDDPIVISPTNPPALGQ